MKAAAREPDDARGRPVAARPARSDVEAAGERPSATMSSQTVMRLQSRAGNAAVARLVDQRASPSPPACVDGSADGAGVLEPGVHRLTEGGGSCLAAPGNDRGQAKAVQRTASNAAVDRLLAGPGGSSPEAEPRGHVPSVQRTLDRTVPAPEDPDLGPRMQAGMEQELARKREAGGEEAACPATGPGGRPAVDRAEMARKQREIGGIAAPAAEPASSRQGDVAAAATSAVSKTVNAGQAARPAGAPQVAQPGDVKGEATAAAAKAATLADAAYAKAEAEPVPDVPVDVMAPEPVSPVDAEGQALPGNDAADGRVADLADRAQLMRGQAQAVVEQAALERAAGSLLTGNIRRAESSIAEAESGITRTKSNVASRRDVLQQAEGALAVSEQKAAMVGEKAPQMTEKATEAEGHSAPVAADAGELAGQNAGVQPDDEEAAAKSREQGSKLGKVSSDATRVNDAVTQTRDRAGTLAAEAAEATASNAQSKTKVEETRSTLARVDGKLAEMTDQARTAKGTLQSVSGQPAELAQRAEGLSQGGKSALAASQQMEERLHGVQERYRSGMASVPALRPQTGAGGSAPVQRWEDPDNARTYDRRVAVGGETTGQVSAAFAPPSWMTWRTGVDPASAEQQTAGAASEEARREAEIQEIEAEAGGHFENLSGWSKAGIALGLTRRGLERTVSGVRWPGFFRTLAQGLIDPRISLMGALHGFGMIATGVGSLFSGAEWSRDPVGNALKSAADIATGLTIILGSIVGLAIAFTVLMWALAIVTFGLLGPAAGIVTTFCGTVISLVTPILVKVGLVALGLQALVFIKNLVEAATAKKARELQTQSEQMTEDAKNMGAVALVVAPVKLGQIGGRLLGQTALGQAVGAGVRSVGQRFKILPRPAVAPPPVAPPVSRPPGTQPPESQPPAPRPSEPAPPPTPRPYSVAGRTDAQLRLDLDPTPLPGETPALAAERVNAARAEIELRATMNIYEGLGERPPGFEIRGHDAANRANGAHTIERHGSDIPLRKGDAPPGSATVQGRVHGDPPWGNPQNWSYKWTNDATMNRVVNDYVSRNWEAIRSDVATGRPHEAHFNVGNAVGEGFYNSGMMGTGPRVSVYHRTSYVTITIELVPGSVPPRVFVVRVFPRGRGLGGE